MTRREQILREAAHLFAVRGFHGVTVEDLGAAMGISGPALYKHFPNKAAILAEMLVDISEHLLAGGQREAARDGGDLIARLVDFHVDFALSRPDLIRVQDRDIEQLSDADARKVRRLQRRYVEIWVDALCASDGRLKAEEARIRAHAAFGLMNSTPYAVDGSHTDDARPVLRAMALAALTRCS
ncbi:MAG TPA: TetR/AcrR family transcriptional regulator [Mycobacteriales bacterium]|nr:TetR/AcrR family transcriptional regulator [Mycobacteriales bacterium]